MAHEISDGALRLEGSRETSTPALQNVTKKLEEKLGKLATLFQSVAFADALEETDKRIWGVEEETAIIGAAKMADGEPIRKVAASCGSYRWKVSPRPMGLWVSVGSVNTVEAGVSDNTWTHQSSCYPSTRG